MGRRNGFGATEFEISDIVAFFMGIAVLYMIYWVYTYNSSPPKKDKSVKKDKRIKK
jgi:hypothetical protein